MVRTLIVGCFLGIAIGACAREPRASAPEARPSAASVGAGFTPPGEDGYGRAGEIVYLEQIIGDAKPSDTLPMLVLIHGRGDEPAHDWLPVTPSTPVRVIMPRAPLDFGTGYSWFPNRALTATGPGGAELARALSERADQIAAAVAILKRERPTRGLPIAGGFSQGGMLSFALAVRHPHAFRAILPIAGLLPESMFMSAAPAAPLPDVLALHGDGDTLVPIDGARNAVRHLDQVGYDVEFLEYPGVPHTITPSMLQAIGKWLDRQLERS